MRKTITVTADAHALLQSVQTTHELPSLSATIIHLHTYQQTTEEHQHNKAFDIIVRTIQEYAPQLEDSPLTQAEIMLTYIKDKNFDALDDNFQDFYHFADLIIDDILTPTHLNRVLKGGLTTDPYNRQKRKHHPYDNSTITTTVQLEGFNTRAEQELSYD